MSQPRASLLQGTLDLLILKALSAGESTALAFLAASSRSPAERLSSNRARSFPRCIGSRNRAG